MGSLENSDKHRLLYKSRYLFNFRDLRNDMIITEGYMPFQRSLNSEDAMAIIDLDYCLCCAVHCQ